MCIKFKKDSSCHFLIIITKLFKEISLFFFLLLISIENFIRDKWIPKRIKIGVIGEHYSQNIGNNLLKYAMFIKLKELGFNPQIIGYLFPGNDISALSKIINIRIVKESFREIKRKDYDILMVNSDQVWKKGNLYCLDIGFLNFAKNWKITKFIYGASLGSDIWNYERNEDIVLKELLKQFTGVSVREKGTITLVENHLNISPILVVDPTLLIDKKYYLDLIKDYKNEFNSNDSYIFAYDIEKMLPMELFINQSVNILKYKLYRCTVLDKDYLRRFIYGIYKCKAVITNSYHGILFSIIFRKPFVAFNLKYRGNDRFNTLIDVYGLKKRIVSDDNPSPSISLLTEPFDVDMKIFDEIRKQSIDYLKKNLKIEAKK